MSLYVRVGGEVPKDMRRHCQRSRDGQEERAAKQGTRQAGSRERVSGRKPKLYGPVAGLLGALCQWQGCHSPCDKSVSPKSDFKIIFR